MVDRRTFGANLLRLFFFNGKFPIYTINILKEINYLMNTRLLYLVHLFVSTL